MAPIQHPKAAPGIVLRRMSEMKGLMTLLTSFSRLDPSAGLAAPKSRVSPDVFEAPCQGLHMSEA